MQNLGCAAIPPIVAWLYNTSGHRYVPNVELLFVWLGVIGFVVGLYMNYYDINHNSVLNRGCAADDEYLLVGKGNDVELENYSTFEIRSTES
jgi:hypothetical protein